MDTNNVFPYSIWFVVIHKEEREVIHSADSLIDELTEENTKLHALLAECKSTLEFYGSMKHNLIKFNLASLTNIEKQAGEIGLYTQDKGTKARALFGKLKEMG